MWGNVFNSHENSEVMKNLNGFKNWLHLLNAKYNIFLFSFNITD